MNGINGNFYKTSMEDNAQRKNLKILYALPKNIIQSKHLVHLSYAR